MDKLEQIQKRLDSQDKRLAAMSGGLDEEAMRRIVQSAVDSRVAGLARDIKNLGDSSHRAAMAIGEIRKDLDRIDEDVGDLNVGVAERMDDLSRLIQNIPTGSPQPVATDNNNNDKGQKPQQEKKKMTNDEKKSFADKIRAEMIEVFNLKAADLRKKTNELEGSLKGIAKENKRLTRDNRGLQNHAARLEDHAYSMDKAAKKAKKAEKRRRKAVKRLDTLGMDGLRKLPEVERLRLYKDARVSKANIRITEKAIKTIHYDGGIPEVGMVTVVTEEDVARAKQAETFYGNATWGKTFAIAGGVGFVASGLGYYLASSSDAGETVEYGAEPGLTSVAGGKM